MKPSLRDPYAAARSVLWHGERLLWAGEAKSTGHKPVSALRLAGVLVLYCLTMFALLGRLWIDIPREIIAGRLDATNLLCAVAMIEVVVGGFLLARMLRTGVIYTPYRKCYAITDRRVILIDWHAKRWCVARQWGLDALEFVSVDWSDDGTGSVLLAWAALDSDTPKLTGILGVANPDELAALIFSTEYGREAASTPGPRPSGEVDLPKLSPESLTASNFQPRLWPGEEISYSIDAPQKSVPWYEGMWLFCKYPVIAALFLFPVVFATSFRLGTPTHWAAMIGLGLALAPALFVFLLSASSAFDKPKTTRFMVTNRRVMSWNIGCGPESFFAYPGSEISFAFLAEAESEGAMFFTLLPSDPVGLPIRLSVLSRIPNVMAFAAAMRRESWGKHIEFVDAQGRPIKVDG